MIRERKQCKTVKFHGVYAMFSMGVCQYVGASKNVSHRLNTHFSPSNCKKKKWLNDVDLIYVWDTSFVSLATYQVEACYILHFCPTRNLKFGDFSSHLQLIEHSGVPRQEAIDCFELIKERNEEINRVYKSTYDLD